MISTEKRTRIFQLLREGHSLGSAAEQVGVSKTTVAKMRKQMINPPDPVRPGRPPGPSAPTDDPTAPAVDPTTADALTVVRDLLRETVDGYRVAKAANDSSNATKFARLSALLVPALARLEQQEANATDAIVISRSDLAAKKARLQGILTRLAGDVPRCADCGRAIRVSWADTDPEVTP